MCVCDFINIPVNQLFVGGILSLMGLSPLEFALWCCQRLVTYVLQISEPLIWTQAYVSSVSKVYPG